MKLKYLIAILLILILSCSRKTLSNADAVLIGNALMGEVMPSMIKTLFDQTDKKGYKKAVSFCNKMMQNPDKKHIMEIKNKIKESYHISDVSFRRTSLKYRNLKNAPDAQDKKILEQWNSDEKEGKFASTHTMPLNGKSLVWIPIRIISDKCLGCHGSQKTQNKDAYELIKKLYPNDMATDYKLNDLRGAFKVTITP